MRFQCKASEMGFIVSKPFGDNQTYDFVVEINGKFKSVQVKSVLKSAEGKIGHKISIKKGCGRGLSQVYQKGDFDFLVAYIFQTKDFYVIPFDAVEGRRTIYVSEQGYMAPYKEAWHLLKGEKRHGLKIDCRTSITGLNSADIISLAEIEAQRRTTKLPNTG